MAIDKSSIVVITGAAPGIGRSLAVTIAAENVAGIAISDVDAQGLAETASGAEKFGIKVTKHIVDVSVPAPLEAAELVIVNDLPLSAQGVSHIEVEVRTGGPTGPHGPGAGLACSCRPAEALRHARRRLSHR